MFRACLLVLLVAVSAATAAAQTTITAAVAVTGLESVQQLGDYLIVDPSSKPNFEPIGVVKIQTEAANVIVKATDAERRNLPTTKIDTNTYVIVAQGRIWIRVVCLDFEKNIYTDEETEFVIGTPTPPVPPGPTPPNPPGPTPPNPPTPTPDNVPPDAFDNLGQRVAQWAAGMPANQQLGSIYLKYANMLRGPEGRNMTVTDAGAKLKAEVAAVPSYAQYTVFQQNLNQDFSQRWSRAPMPKGVLADYWAAVAAGLGVR